MVKTRKCNSWNKTQMDIFFLPYQCELSKTGYKKLVQISILNDDNILHLVSFVQIKNITQLEVHHF